MKKFNYTDWVTKNKYGKTLKENFTPDLEDDERKRKLIQQMIAKEKEARKKEITGMEDVNEEYSLWDKLKPEQRIVILDQLPFLQDPNKQKALASLSYDELMGKFPEKKERYMIDTAIEDEYAMGDVNEEPNEGNAFTAALAKAEDEGESTFNLNGKTFKLEEVDPEAIKGKHYPDEKTVKKLKKGPYTPGGQNAHIDEEDLTFEPEDMDNPDEDLVIIGGGYLDIKTKFNRPNMRNDDLAAMGQKVVNNKSILQLKGEMPEFDNKEAALKYIYDEINEVDDGKGGQQEPSEDEGEGGQEDLIAVFKEEDDDKKDWTPEDYEEEEEYEKYFKFEELAEALGYINKKK